MEARIEETFEEVRKIKEERVTRLAHRVFRILHRAVTYEPETQTLWIWKTIPLEQGQLLEIQSSIREKGEASSLFNEQACTTLSQLIPSLALCHTDQANLNKW